MPGKEGCRRPLVCLGVFAVAYIYRMKNLLLCDMKQKAQKGKPYWKIIIPDPLS